MVDAGATAEKSKTAAHNGTFNKPQEPGAGAPLFHGIRVVELACMVAAPQATAILAYLGAEVIKVEDKIGDVWRTVLLGLDQVPQKREFSCMFETANLNKKSVQMDLRASREALLSLLKDADVFVTNVRPSSLKRLELDYESLRSAMPHLVYAHVTAFGRSGPMADNAGYDVGAFWAMTGMAEKIMPVGCYAVYPIAFGDNTLCGGILGGIAAGLYRRMQTGQGSLVDGSLVHMGAWCMMPYLNKAPHAPTARRTYSANDTPSWEDMNYCSYHTKEWDITGDEIVVLGLGTTTVEDALNVTTFDDAQRMFDTMTIAEAEEFLRTHDVPFVRKRGLDNLAKYDARCAKAFSPIPGVSDVEYLPIPPLYFSCSAEHRVAFRAPALGEHNDACTWAPRHASALLPTTVKAMSDTRPTSLLYGITVVELSSVHTACMASGSILRELGARVVSIVAGDGLQYWLGRNAAYATQLQQGKEEVVLDIDSKKGQDQLLELLRGAQVFLTNFSKKHLEKCGLGDDVVRAVLPSLIYCRIDTWLHDDFGTSEGTLGAWYATSVARGMFRRMRNALPVFPTQLGELCASQYVAAGCMAALFHRARTGEGQLCGTNLQHLGIWASHSFYAFLQKNPQSVPMFSASDYKGLVENQPLPVVNAFKTMDGVWVMTLGVDTRRHLPRYFDAFDIKWSCLWSLAWTVLFEVVPKIFDKDIMAKVAPIVRTIHIALRDAIGSVTFATFQELSVKYDLWYAPVNTVESFLATPKSLLEDHVSPIKHSRAGWSVRHPVFVVPTIPVQKHVGGG